MRNQPAAVTADPIAFVLQPYFYQTNWFLPLCGVMTALAGSGAYRLRVRRMREHMQIVVSERSRIARELHDTLMQGFSGVTMEMQGLSTRLPPSPHQESLQEIIRDAEVCLRNARRSVAGLRRAIADEAGLAGTIAEAARHITETHDIRLRLRMEGRSVGLSTEVQYNLLRISQEAVTNAVKHSACNLIEVCLDVQPNMLHLSIKDDGVGLSNDEEGTAPAGHYGLIGMRERASQIGAQFQIESEAGNGTLVTVTLPLGLSRAAALPAVGRTPHPIDLEP